jgi:hypothetical protein
VPVGVLAAGWRSGSRRFRRRTAVGAPPPDVSEGESLSGSIVSGRQTTRTLVEHSSLEG